MTFVPEDGALMPKHVAQSTKVNTSYKNKVKDFTINCMAKML
jgi:hypothetical protein